MYERANDRERALSFLEELLPKLRSWHEYLYRERSRNGDGLVEIWHPWESGMDNSPLWDDALARLELDPAEIPDYERVDVQLADASERPSDREYDRYAYLVGLFRELDYRSASIGRASPFVLQPVLFNALLVQSNRDLAQIARVVGADGEEFEAWADRTAAGLEERLWSEDDALYLDFDVEVGDVVDVRTAAGLSPLYAGVPGPDRARRMIDRGWQESKLPFVDEFYELRAAVRRCERDERPDRAFTLVEALWWPALSRHAEEIARLAEETLERWPAIHPLRPRALGAASVARLVVGDARGRSRRGRSAGPPHAREDRVLRR